MVAFPLRRIRAAAQASADQTDREAAAHAEQIRQESAKAMADANRRIVLTLRRLQPAAPTPAAAAAPVASGHDTRTGG